MQRPEVEVEQHVCSKLKSSVYFRRAQHQAEHGSQAGGGGGVLGHAGLLG